MFIAARQICSVFVITLCTCLAQDVTSYLNAGDKLMAEMRDYRAALEQYQRAEALNPKNYDVLWRISRAYLHIGETMQVKTDAQKEEQLRLFYKSREYSEKAIQSNPSGMAGYLRRAMANGRIATHKGLFSAVSLVNEVKNDVEKAINLDRENSEHKSWAHYMLAKTHAGVCGKPYLLRLPLGLGWGDRNIATEEFEKAIELYPESIRFRLDAAKNLVDLDLHQKAREHLSKIENLPLRDDDDAQLKQEAADLMRKIRNK